MKNRPRISILLPIWNSEQTLESALRSIARQSEADFECVAVDDGSTDGSASVLHAFARRDTRFRVITRKHEGLVSTLNAGAELCRAPVVARMDADDYMHRHRLALQLAALERHPQWVAVGCLPRLFPRAELHDGRRRYERWLQSLDSPELIFRDRYIECPIAHPTLTVRRDALLRTPYRDHGWPEDHDLILRLLRAGPCVGTVPRRLLGWRDSPSRLSRTDPRYALDRFTACRAHHLRHDFLAGESHYTLWGHGRTGRALKRALAEHDLETNLIVDVHPRRIGQRIANARVIAPDSLASARPNRIIVSVAGSKPRREIRAALLEMDFREGQHFVVAA